MMPMGGMAMNPMMAMAAMANMAAASGGGGACAASGGAVGTKKATSKSGGNTKGTAPVQAFSHVELQERLLKAQSSAASESVPKRSVSPERAKVPRRSPEERQHRTR